MSGVGQSSSFMRGWERRRSVRVAAMVVVSALGLTVGELSVPSTAFAEAAKPAKAVQVASRPDAVSASITARSQGSRVEVESERTETSSTFVNPDGSLTSQAFGGPVRTRGVDGAWRDLDFALAEGPDGSVVPRVHPTDLRLSGGTPSGVKAAGGVSQVVSVVQSPVQGAAADVRLAERAAKKAAAGKGVKAGKGVSVDGAALVGARVAAAEKLRVSFGWAGALPKPVLSGTTATYRDVQPGVDLVVKVLRTGYEQFFVIRSAAGLKGLQAKGLSAGGGVSWELPVSAPGLTARLGRDGAVELVDRHGRSSWRYGAPRAWDAKIDPRSGEPVSSAPVKLGLKSAGAGRSVVTVTPDQKWLADPKRRFPITVDPYAGATGWSSFDTTVQSDTVNTDLSTSTELKVGTFDGGTTKARAFISFPLAVFKGKKIMSANLYPVLVHSWSCTPSEVRIFETASVSTATRWSNQPGATTAGTAPYGRLSTAKGYSSSCPSGRVSIPMTTLAQKWADNTATGGTLRLSAADETSSNGWKKFASREATTTGVPQIAFTYNRKPNAATAPVPAAASLFPFTPAGSTVNTNYVNTLKPTFTSTATDPDGTTVRLTTEVHTSTTTSASTLAGSCVSGFVASGANGSCTLGTALTDSVRYYARTAVFDGTTWNGTWSPWSSFVTAAATVPNGEAVIACPGYSNGQWDTTPPASSITCTVSAAGVAQKSAAPGYIDVAVDGAAFTRVKITPSTDPGVAKTTVTVPNTAGGHRVTARSVMVTNKVGTTQVLEFGYGDTVNMTKPAAGAKPTAWGAIAVAGSGPPKGTSTVTGKSQWRVAGDGTRAWVDGGALTASGTTGPVSVSGSFDTRAAITQADGTALNPRVPVLLEVRACIGYSAAPTQCAASTRQVLRVPHAFGNGFPTTDVGVGQVALFTGEFNTDTTDVSVPGYTGDLSLSRSHSTYGNSPAAAVDVTTGVFGPGWTANIDGGDAGAAGLQVVDSTRVDGTIALVDGDGSASVFGTPSGARRTGAALAAGTYVAVDDDTELDGSKLTVVDEVKADATGLTVTGTDGVLDLRLTEDDGTVTTFAGRTAPTATTDATFTPGLVKEPGVAASTAYSRDSLGRITRILAPLPPGVTSCATMVAGCRALSITYATATTATATTPGDVLGQVQSVSMTIHSATALTARTCAGGTTALPAGMVSVPVACYLYDSAKRLVKAGDPRSGLATQYAYDAEQRITTFTPAGLTPVSLGYTGTGAGQTPKLSTVTRARPTPENGTATTTSIVYDVPTTGNAGLPDLSKAKTDGWEQGRTVTYGVAVFDAAHPAPSTDPAALGAADWAYADLSYTDVEGYTTNTASYGAGDWQLTSTDYDTLGNVTRQLDAGAIAAVVADGSSARADQLSTQTVYNAEVKAGDGTVLAPAGSLVTDTFGPARTAVLKDGTSALVRPHTRTAYDQGAPNGGINPATGGGYNLATTETSSAYELGAGVDRDVETTLTRYTPIDDASSTGPTSGWVLGAPTQVVQDLDSSGTITADDIVNRTRYDDEGKTVESRQPSATTGTGPETRLTAYYTAATQAAPNAACGGKPEWAGLTCRTYPADHTSSTGVLPDSTTTGFTYLLAPTTVVEKSAGTTPGSVTRTSTTTYLLDGRVDSTRTAMTGLASSVPQGGTKNTYDPATGAVTEVVKLDSAGNPTTTKATTTYDPWGRVTAAKNELGDDTLTTYDTAGRTATVTDAKGVTTFTYDGTDAAGKVERRGLATKVTVTRAGNTSTAGNLLTFAGAYDADGALVKQTMPGNVIQRTRYDDAGEPVERSYSGQVTPVTSSTDADGNTVYTPGTPVADRPWLVWHQDNDVQGRVRHEATPDGAAFNADPGSDTLGGVVPNTGDALAFDRTYTYDTADRLTQVADRTATETNTEVDGTASADAPCTVRTYAFAGSAGLNGNRTGLTETTHSDGTCTGTATSTHTWTYAYDDADRQTTATAKDGAAAVGSYTYDAMGRQTLLPAADAPDPTQGDVTLGYHDSDLPAWVQQNGVRTTYTLDVASHRLVSTTGPAGGTATSTTTRHYTDESDNPAWVDVDNDAAGPNAAVTTRFAESLGGDLAVHIGEDGSADLTLATLHGDTATTLTLPAAQDESTSGTGINGWSDYTEYGTSRASASTDAVDGPLGYGWLGAKQRSTTPESAGLTLMGDRYYNAVTGRFTSTDPEPGGNVNTYTYPNDPTNTYDLDGHFGWGKWIDRVGTVASVGAMFGCAACGVVAAAISIGRGFYKVRHHDRSGWADMAGGAFFGAGKALRYGNKFVKWNRIRRAPRGVRGRARHFRARRHRAARSHHRFHRRFTRRAEFVDRHYGNASLAYGSYGEYRSFRSSGARRWLRGD